MRPEPQTPLSRQEFVLLIAFMVSIVAMSTDVMLPALGTIGADLGAPDPNDAQLIVTALFLGFGTGMLIAGPLSDSYGRKPVIYGGYAIFLIGCLLSTLATSWEVMILGRVLQGIGAAFPRVVTVALVRDGYEGRGMASIMSVVMAVFVLVPMVAPALGQVIIYLSGWRATFVFLMLMAALAATWFALRQPETLTPDKRRAFSVTALWQGLAEVCRSRVAMGYTLAAGLIFGAFIAYLSSAQQVFVQAYDAGPLFALYFAIASFALGLASILNSRLVMRLGMRILTWWAVLMLTVLAAAFLVPALLWDGLPPLWAFIAWLMGTFFCVGSLFGNLNALAMTPLGHIAGLGAAVVGALSNFIALPLAYAIGHAFDGGVLHLVYGFAGLGFGTILVILWTERGVPKAQD